MNTKDTNTSWDVLKSQVITLLERKDYKNAAGVLITCAIATLQDKKARVSRKALLEDLRIRSEAHNLWPHMKGVFTGELKRILKRKLKRRGWKFK
jgi:hypothetical protein